VAPNRNPPVVEESVVEEPVIEPTVAREHAAE
jgi:hypothetical protein